MTIQDIGLFQAINAKMEYLNQRQGVIARNIANSDTPGYRPKDLVEVDFSKFMKGSLGEGARSVSMAATNEGHLPNSRADIDIRSKKQNSTYEVAPSGNAVVIEEQLLNSGRNTMDYNMMINLYQKQVGMIRMALGNGR